MVNFQMWDDSSNLFLKKHTGGNSSVTVTPAARSTSQKSGTVSDSWVTCLVRRRFVLTVFQRTLTICGLAKCKTDHVQYLWAIMIWPWNNVPSTHGRFYFSDCGWFHLVKYCCIALRFPHCYRWRAFSRGTSHSIVIRRKHVTPRWPNEVVIIQ